MCKLKNVFVIKIVLIKFISYFQPFLFFILYFHHILFFNLVYSALPLGTPNISYTRDSLVFAWINHYLVYNIGAKTAKL